MSSVSLPLTYRALGNDDLTAPLTVVHRTVSELAADELLIRVTHASLNAMDPRLQRVNLFQLPLPIVLGFDIAGIVVALGGEQQQAEQNEHNDVVLGSEVLGHAARGGGFGEYVVVPRHHVVLRRGVPSVDGSTLAVAFCTAYEGLEMELRLSSEQYAGQNKVILIPGAAGGVGHFAVQLAKRAGLRVIGTTSKTAGVALLQQLGVDLVIDYAQHDVSEAVLAYTDGRGADLVWDSTCKPASLEQSARLVASGGCWCRLGTAQQSQLGGATDYNGPFRIARARDATATFSDYARWLRGGPAAESRPHIRAEVLNQAIDCWHENSVRPCITRELPFDAAALQRALDDMREGRSNVGKTVVKVAVA